MTIGILLADDHGVMREGLRAILEKQADFQVMGEAADGIQAVRETLAVRPHVVLMDINMPLLNGIEAARRIRQESPETQVIILSMYASKEHVYQALSAGARGYLLKESSSRLVAEAIRTVMAGERYLSPAITDTMIDDYLLHRGQSGTASPWQDLSAREREVLQLVVEGKSSAQIAELLQLSASTVNTYRSRLMKKVGVDDLPALIEFAVQNNIITRE
jgi:DNA-binding NarL/FixJ family response regulator